MKEIGSFFNLSLNNTKLRSNEFNKNYIFLNSGRTCLNYINCILPIGKILTPNYLCSSMKMDREIISYNIIDQLTIDYFDLKNIINNSENIVAILIVNYFGRIDQNIEIIQELCESNNICIIEDRTHNFITENNDYGDITFSSLRKTLPIIDGAYLHIRKDMNLSIQLNINMNPYQSLTFSYLKYLNCKIFGSLLKNFKLMKFIWRPLLLQSDDMFEDNNYNYKIPSISMFILKHLDLEKIYNKRIENNKYLFTELETCSFYDEYVGSFGFPVKFNDEEERNHFRNKLIQNNIYCPIHWKLSDSKSNCSESICSNNTNDSNNSNDEYKSISKNISETIMTIPSDQRYNINDLKRVVNNIKNNNIQK